MRNRRVHRHYVNQRGDLVWVFGDSYHREIEPAIINSDGDKYWYRHGKLHREDGPAIEVRTPAIAVYWWYINGVRLPSIDAYLAALDATDAEKVLIKMQYG